ncbi:MAG: cytochrome-c peroxidase [Bacteroidia bacterium]
MRLKIISFIFLIFSLTAIFSFNIKDRSNSYITGYTEKLSNFNSQQTDLVKLIKSSDLNSADAIELIKNEINQTRNQMKGMDIWLRYLNPVAYKKINGPLPVEWETEVFEKWEKPYKRIGAGFTLAQIYLDEENIDKQHLLGLIEESVENTKSYFADSITDNLKTYHHFFLCNRLYLLNLAAIYTTGFECPNPERVIPELQIMMEDVNFTYSSFNESFSETPLSTDYIHLYAKAMDFVKAQPADNSKFDHFTFIKDFINPLFAFNQKLIKKYKVSTRSLVDYSINKESTSIFDKQLYYGQNSKGIFLRVNDKEALTEIDKIGKLLFYDPILSANNLRSCASCHKTSEYFTDTVSKTSMQFDHKSFLPRNTPSLINAGFNHLLMLDGKHITLQHQGKDVITNPLEMGSDEKEILKKVLSCGDYKKAFTKLLKYTPQEKEITVEHIVSAISFYYSKFSNYYAPFDNAINNSIVLDASAKQGFNVFMSKAQCATCHFVPQFNGVKPPYVGSEFEVLGVPADTAYSKLSTDKGRFGINPAIETANAFRTGSLRNAQYTKPYMHNGVFASLNEVVDFYDGGGGAGRGLKVENQTLSSDSLHLTKTEKHQLVQFMKSLNEDIIFEVPPTKLPVSKNKAWNKRKVGGEY